MMDKLERNLEVTEQLLQMVADEPLSLVAVIQHEERAHVGASTKDGILFLGEPYLVGGIFNKFQGQWRVNNISAAKIEGLQEFIEHAKKKDPNVNIWLSDSFSKLQNQTDVVLQKKAEQQLKQLQQYVNAASNWQFPPMLIRVSDSTAEVISHDFIITSYVPEYSGDPIVIIVKLTKTDGQWQFLGWSQDYLRSISHALFKRKYPQGRIWLDPSTPDWLKPDQKTEVSVDIEAMKHISEKLKPDYSLAEKIRAITGDKEIFESYFPDSIKGDKALDKWWPTKSKDPDIDKKIFDMVRNGLRTVKNADYPAYRNRYIKWIGQKYIWGKKPQNQDAIELMYHATFDQELAYDAIYNGLSVVLGKKNDKILKRFVELCMADIGVTRILWGTRGQHENMIQYLATYLASMDSEIRVRAVVLEKVFKGEIDYGKWSENQLKEKLQREIGDKLVEIKEVLSVMLQTELDIS